jgi:hypothetical protein
MPVAPKSVMTPSKPSLMRSTDPKAVGAEVKRQMDANQRQQASRDRSALADKD